jgi:hypothetical protein
VILVLYPKPAAILARDLHNLGETPLLVGQSAMSDPLAFAEQVGIPGATDNFYTINQVAFTPTDPQAEKWAKLIEEAFPEDRLSPYNLFGVGAAKVAVEALQRASPDPRELHRGFGKHQWLRCRGVRRADHLRRAAAAAPVQQVAGVADGQGRPAGGGRLSAAVG